MVADFFTKPLQGNLFRKFKAVIMGYKHIDSLKESVPIPSQERVGKDRLEEMRNGIDGPSTVVGRSEMPTKVTYADVVRKGDVRKSDATSRSQYKYVGSERKNIVPLTFKK